MNPQDTLMVGHCGNRHAGVMENLRRRHGIGAELAAAGYLESRGLRLLARNLRCKLGELDLVCLDGEVLVIVEVRLRGNSDFGGALASVTSRKQARLIRTTQLFLQSRPGWRERVIRFDVVGLNRHSDIVWVKDAFRTT